MPYLIAILTALIVILSIPLVTVDDVVVIESPTATQEILKEVQDVPAIEEDPQTLSPEETKLPAPEAQETPREHLTPVPLTGPDVGVSVLTREGVIAWTNARRAQDGLPLLKESLALSRSATVKLGDMFERQYFAHESPDGLSVNDLVEQFGYAFLVVGENLALGNFPHNETLVQGWMDSPGHRENILNPQYTEIGVSVQQGIYNGRETWIAVQHFGKPRSACPTVSLRLAEEIEENQDILDNLLVLLQEKKQELNTLRPGSAAYNETAKEYNELANQYNELLTQVRQQILTYNEQVAAYNSCIQGD